MAPWIDDVTLTAYVDGELNPDQMKEVEKHLAGDARGRLKVRRMREISSLLHAACAESNFQDVPDCLMCLSQRCPGRSIRIWLGRGLVALILMVSYVGAD